MPNPQLEDQDSVLISPGDRVTLLHPLVPVLILVDFCDTNELWWSSDSPGHHMGLPRLTAHTESISLLFPGCSVCVYKFMFL
jgi:hypothetical protein